MLDKTAILKDAQKYLAKGAVDKAISELEKLVKESPDGNTYNMIGDIYLRKGTQKSAIEYYQKAAVFFRQEDVHRRILEDMQGQPIGYKGHSWRIEVWIWKKRVFFDDCWRRQFLEAYNKRAISGCREKYCNSDKKKFIELINQIYLKNSKSL